MLNIDVKYSITFAGYKKWMKWSGSKGRKRSKSEVNIGADIMALLWAFTKLFNFIIETKFKNALGQPIGMERGGRSEGGSG